MSKNTTYRWQFFVVLWASAIAFISLLMVVTCALMNKLLQPISPDTALVFHGAMIAFLVILIASFAADMIMGLYEGLLRLKEKQFEMQERRKLAADPYRYRELLLKIIRVCKKNVAVALSTISVMFLPLLAGAFYSSLLTAFSQSGVLVGIWLFIVMLSYIVLLVSLLMVCSASIIKRVLENKGKRVEDDGATPTPPNDKEENEFTKLIYLEGEDKQRALAVLHKYIDEADGPQTARVLQAAVTAGWLKQLPKASQYETEFSNVTGRSVINQFRKKGDPQYDEFMELSNQIKLTL